jgi:hypothetical protein
MQGGCPPKLYNPASEIQHRLFLEPMEMLAIPNKMGDGFYSSPFRGNGTIHQEQKELKPAIPVSFCKLRASLEIKEYRLCSQTLA